MPAWKAPSVRTRFPPMPLLATPNGRPCAASRRASTSGHRPLMSAVDRAPSVIESPNATTVSDAAGAITSIRPSPNQLCVVATTGTVGLPAWFPVSVT